MSAQRELNADRMASIKNCKAKGGPLNCRYHSGVISDCMKDIRGTTNALINEKKEVDVDTQQKNKEVLENNVQQLLDIYKTNSDETFELQDGTVLNQEEIINIRNSLEHINKALKYGDYNGKTLETCINEFNKLIGVPLERITSSDEKIFYNRSVRGTLENNSLIQQLIPNLIEEINTDGSLNLNNLVPLEQQQEAVTFFKGVLSDQLFEVSKLKTAYIDFKNDLELLYPPMVPFDPLEMRMNKQDVKEYWGYITKKHPVLEENYYSVMNKTAPETVQDLQAFKDAIIYQPSALITQENALRSMKRYGLLTPAGIYLATKLYPKYTNNIKTSQQNQQNDNDIQLADSILTKVIEGNSPDSGSLTLQRLKALSVNWDAHKILDTITDPKTGSTLQQEYQAALETTKRIVYPDGSIQYDILCQPKLSTLSIQFTNNTEKPIIQFNH